MFKIGRCFSAFNKGDTPYREAAKLGYSYLEVPLRGLKRMSNKKLEQIRANAAGHNLEIYSTNLFFKGSVRLFVSQRRKEKLFAYAEKVLAKAQLLGVKVAVLGSGHARKKPANISHKQAQIELVDFFIRIADIAAGYDIVIALEPLNREETNMINSTADGIEFVKLVNRSNFRLLIDYYHMMKENEDMSVIQLAAPVLAHAHIATHDRKFPAQERFDEYREFLDALHNVSYNGRITIESNFAGESDVRHLDIRQ